MLKIKDIAAKEFYTYENNDKSEEYQNYDSHKSNSDKQCDPDFEPENFTSPFHGSKQWHKRTHGIPRSKLSSTKRASCNKESDEFLSLITNLQYCKTPGLFSFTNGGFLKEKIKIYGLLCSDKWK